MNTIPIIQSKDYNGAYNSNIGGRSENQDSCAFSNTQHGLLLVVCDGMGGGPSGKTASTLAVHAIVATVKNAEKGIDMKKVLGKACVNANNSIRGYVAEHPETQGMGTTAVIALLSKQSVLVCHIGDSRFYLFRGNKMVFRTTDHSRVEEMFRSGDWTEEQARTSSMSNIITRAIGPMEEVLPEFDEIPYLKGDRFVLCTDGVWGSMSADELRKNLTRFPSLPGVVESMSIKVDELGASEGGHHDNHTLIVVQSNINSILKTKMTKEIKLILASLIMLLVISVIFILSLCSSRSTLFKEVEKMKVEIAQKDSTIEILQKDLLEKVQNYNEGKKKEKEKALKEEIKQKDLLELKEKVQSAYKFAKDIQTEMNRNGIKSASPKLRKEISKLKEMLQEISTEGNPSIVKTLEAIEKASKEEKFDNMKRSFNRVVELLAQMEGKIDGIKQSIN